MDSRTIGMHLWLAPQISEHWLNHKPAWDTRKEHWFRCREIASTFKLGVVIAQEWITLVALIKTRTWALMGITVQLSTSKSPNMSFEDLDDSM